MTEGDQDHGRAAMTPAIAFGSLDQTLDLGLGQVLADTVLAVRLAAAFLRQLFAFRWLA
jgi:hypothetical protein